MATSRLSVELEAMRLQSLYDLSVSKSRKTAHSGGDHNCVVSPLVGRRQIGNAVAFASSLNQLARDIARDVEGLSNSATLRHKAWEIVGSCEKHSFWQFLNLYPDRQLHMS
jgi:hypothetical protein